MNLKVEINHILESGVNDIRLTELFNRYSKINSIALLKWMKENKVSIDLSAINDYCFDMIDYEGLTAEQLYNEFTKQK